MLPSDSRWDALVSNYSSISNKPFPSYSYLYNILASVALISEFYDLKNIDEKLFYNFKLSSSRGDITRVRLKNGQKEM